MNYTMMVFPNVYLRVETVGTKVQLVRPRKTWGTSSIEYQRKQNGEWIGQWLYLSQTGGGILFSKHEHLWVSWQPSYSMLKRWTLGDDKTRRGWWIGNRNLSELRLGAFHVNKTSDWTTDKNQDKCSFSSANQLSWKTISVVLKFVNDDDNDEQLTSIPSLEKATVRTLPVWPDMEWSNGTLLES